MNRTNVIRGVLSAAIVWLAAQPSSANAGLTVTPDRNNVVSSRLEGRWKADGALCERLGSKARFEIVEFKSGPEVVEDLPERYIEYLKGRTIYMAGWIVAGGQEAPFILIDVKGNPYIVYFRKRDGVPMGDSESFNVMMAVAADASNDLLFIGGDFNNQPFAAFQRVPAVTGDEDSAPAEDESVVLEGAAGLASYTGRWQDEEKSLALTINAAGFEYQTLRGRRVERHGGREAMTLLEDRLVIGRPEEDGGYLTLSDRGTLWLKQEGSGEGIELLRIE